MENNDLTYWKNYQTAMQWIKGDVINYDPAVEETEVIDDKDEQLEFAIDDDLLDFYRLTQDHKANRSKCYIQFDEKIIMEFVFFSFRKSKISREK